tara:strand:- start:972 stop:1532 length:561 start_codon:yes stop_codon:yes gene_type:complete
MSIKLVVLRSGEDIIAHVTDMSVDQHDAEGEVVGREIFGYYLTRPCAVKLLNEEDTTDDTGRKAFEISMFPWIPLSGDKVVKIPCDWVVTIVEPIEKVKDMFELQVLGDGKTKGEVSDAYGSTRLKGSDPSAHGKLDPSHDFIKSVMPSREEIDREEAFEKAKTEKQNETSENVDTDDESGSSESS